MLDDLTTCVNKCTLLYSVIGNTIEVSQAELFSFIFRLRTNTSRLDVILSFQTNVKLFKYSWKVWSFLLCNVSSTLTISYLLELC